MISVHYPQRRVAAPVALGMPLLMACLMLALASCSSSPERATHATSGASKSGYGRADARDARSNEVLMRAIGLVGTPYRYGGNTPQSGFDCSGLVDFVFLDAAGLSLPRSTRELIAMDAPKVRPADLRPGDLLFFNPGGGATSHIGIYVGEGRFVHAPSSGGTVRLDVLDERYWQRYYQGARRVLR